MLLDEPFWSSSIAAFPSSVRSLVAMTRLFSSITIDQESRNPLRTGFIWLVSKEWFLHFLSVEGSEGATCSRTLV